MDLIRKKPVPTNACNHVRWAVPGFAGNAPLRLTLLNRIWLVALRSYLVLAGGLVFVRTVQLALGR